MADVTIVLTEEDAYVFQRHFFTIKQKGIGRMMRWGFPCAWMALGLFLFAPHLFGHPDTFENRFMFWIFCAAGALNLLAGPALWTLALRNYARKNVQAMPGFGKPALFTFDDSSFNIATDAGETRLNWSAVELTEVESHLFLWPSRINALILPKRAFVDNEPMLGRIRGLAADRAGTASASGER